MTMRLFVKNWKSVCVLSSARFPVHSTPRHFSAGPRAANDDEALPSNDSKTSDDSPETQKLTEQQKQNLKHVWGDYVDYMSHQRDKGWKT